MAVAGLVVLFCPAQASAQSHECDLHYALLNELSLGNGGISVYLDGGVPSLDSRRYGHLLRWEGNKVSRQGPDAFIFSLHPHQMMTAGTRISLQDSFMNPDYDAILKTQGYILLLKKSLLQQERIRVLKYYYYRHFGEFIRRLEPAVEKMEKGPFVITQSFLGHALKYFQLNGNLVNEVYICPNLMVDNVIYQYKIKKYYSFEKPLLRNYKSSVFYSNNDSPPDISLYSNVRVKKEK